MKRLILILGVVALLASVGQADVLMDLGYRDRASSPASDGLYWNNAYTGYPAPGWGPCTDDWIESSVDPNGIGYWQLLGMHVPVVDSDGNTTPVELWTDNFLASGHCGMQNAWPQPTGYDVLVAHDGYDAQLINGTSSFKFINVPAGYYDLSFFCLYDDGTPWQQEGAGTYTSQGQSYVYEADGEDSGGDPNDPNYDPALTALVTFTGLQPTNVDPNTGLGEIQMDLDCKPSNPELPGDPNYDYASQMGTYLLELRDSSMSGDFDRDADVDAADIDLLGTKLGTEVLTSPSEERYDVRSDGLIDGGYVGDSDPDYNDSTDWTELIEVILDTKEGDFDLDGDVDFDDFGALAANYNKAGGWADGDSDGDGDTDFDDFGALASNYNWSRGGGGEPLPEPATLALLGLSSLAVIRRRK